MDIKFFLNVCARFGLQCSEWIIVNTLYLKRGEQSDTVELHFTSLIHKTSLIEILTEINYMPDLITQSTLVIYTDYNVFSSNKKS